MSNGPKRIDWTRYWCPRTGECSLTDDGFLLKDPERDYFSKQARSLGDFSDVPCLVLLGSPGMGKTDELAAAFDNDHGPKLLIDLGRLDGALPLREYFSENSKVKDWAAGTDAPTIWLDSLDEGVGEISNLSRLIETELGTLRQALPNLRVRIACRIANWPASLEKTLTALWPDRTCQVLELLPLRSEDVRQAAMHRGVVFDKLLEAVRNAKAGPLAAKPVTLLRMLLPEFEERGQLPGNQAKLYELGCKRLATEWAVGRQEGLASANDDAEGRFKAAQFVAAAMTFYGRNVLDCTPERDIGASDAVHSRELGSTGSIDGHLASVPSVTDVESVAKTALMSGAAAQHLYRFEHRTFQEYLAARFLFAQKLPLPKVLALFLNPSSTDRRVVPQLIETAAWLAAMDPRFRDALVQSDPVAVLHSDVGAQDDATQRALFAALCDGLRKGEISETEWTGWRDLCGLHFNGMGAEIRAILNNTAQPEQVREFAIDVAWHARTYEVYDLLADLALDTTRPLREREHCTYALAHAPDQPPEARTAKARLAQLLNAAPADDPNDTLRGNALRALWHKLDPQSLFAALRPYHNPNYIGAYWDVLGVIRRGLEDRHVLAGLAWTEAQPQAHALESGLRQLMARVFNLAWQNLDRPGVLDALARAAVIRLAFSEDLRLDSDGEDDHDRYNRRPSDKPSELANNDPETVARRRKLCCAMVSKIADHKSAAFWLGYYMVLTQPTDFEWLLEQYLAATSEAERKVWLELAQRVWLGSVEQVAVVHQLGALKESVREAFRGRIALLDPDSAESKAARVWQEQHEAKLRETAAKNTPELLVPSPAQLIETHLQEFERGDLVAWWKLWYLMWIDEYGRHIHGRASEPDIRTTPYWAGSTPELRERLLAAAEKYVNHAREAPDEWIGKQVIHRPSVAGLAALILLFHERRTVIDSLPSGVWARWTHIVLDFPDPDKENVLPTLRSIAYRNAPDAFRNAVDRLLRTQLEEQYGSRVLRKLKPIWDHQLSATVFEIVSKTACTTDVLGDALDTLLAQDYRPGREWCLGQIDEAVSAGHTTDPRLPSVVSALLLNGPTSAEWTKLWSLLGTPANVAFALKMLGKERYRRITTSDKLSETQLADLYIWLHYHAPEVKRSRGVYSPGPADKLEDLKREVLHILMHRGTPVAVAQCERIHVELKLDWFRRVIIEARARLRHAGWVPIRPQDLWRYVTSAKTVIVRGERELCDAVMHALDRINNELQGENPSAPDLWAGSKPHDEIHLSNWLLRALKRELSQAGVYIGREIAVNLRGKTDIQVIAKPVADEPEFGLIIEVKGCWHKEVQTAMKTQLLDEYLANHSFCHGVYVVGWFYCEAWKDKKDRSRRTRHIQTFRAQTRDEAQRQFAAQADALSSNTKTIRAFVLDTALRI